MNRTVTDVKSMEEMMITKIESDIRENLSQCPDKIRGWQWLRLVFGFFACLVMLTTAPVLAAPPITEIQVNLGTATGELKFVPNHLEFVAGQKYKLILNNPSLAKHYFTAKDFADASWTQKVEAGKVEIKGAIHELELKSDAEAEWVFVPMKPGTYNLYCSIPGHAAGGMTGQIVISER